MKNMLGEHNGNLGNILGTHWELEENKDLKSKDLFNLE
jgi:hypothetical protein